MTLPSSSDKAPTVAHPLKKVVEGGYCIGCGVCTVLSSEMTIEETPYGLYQAKCSENASLHTINTDALTQRDNAAAACPFTATLDETTLGQMRHGDQAHFDPRIGYYQSILAGHVSSGQYRASGSSGGLMTWVLVRLLEMKKIDGVIHVVATGQAGNLFEYQISHSADAVMNGAKSRYYPVQMAEILQKVKQSNKRYALVGVPCFVKAARLLAEQDAQISAALCYYMAIFCGHFKSKAFAEMIAWQRQVSPDQLSQIDFRVKDPKQPANRYKVQVAAQQFSRSCSVETPVRQLFGMDWGLGYFKPKACDWCDDIAGECADLACGDAWLPEFVQQSGGNNVAVVRHPELQALLQSGIDSHHLSLSHLSAEHLVASQAANYRHRHEGLALRLAVAATQKIWHPKKRIPALSPAAQGGIPAKRQALYRQREILAEKSHEAFYEAKKRSSLSYFYWRMLPLELRYYYTQGNLIKGGLKSFYTLIQYKLKRLNRRHQNLK